MTKFLVEEFEIEAQLLEVEENPEGFVLPEDDTDRDDEEKLPDDEI